MSLPVPLTTERPYTHTHTLDAETSDLQDPHAPQHPPQECRLQGSSYTLLPRHTPHTETLITGLMHTHGEQDTGKKTIRQSTIPCALILAIG